MLDIKLLRKDPQAIEKLIKSKDPTVNLPKILEMDEEIRQLKFEVEALKLKRNQSAKEIGEKKRAGAEVSDLLKEVDGLKEAISHTDTKLFEKERLLNEALAYLPNIPMKDVPHSIDPKNNVCLKSHLQKPTFTFSPKNHLELGEAHSLFDFKRGVKVGGAGWPAYKGLGARLEWALINFMIDTHINNGFELWIPPLLARKEIMFGSAHLPKFEEQLYKLHDKDHELYLIPTSESVLNGLHFNEILSENSLPLKYVSYTPCFRREAGAAGSSERGLIRTHQFNKVEMFCITSPENSEKMFHEMVEAAEEILKALDLHYKRMLLVTGDISFAAAKTIDLEVFLPGQDRYYEVSSISTCTDFQARRSKLRFKKGQEKPDFPHTLNGSGLATSRLMVALLENNQQEDGSIKIPPPLQKYLGGLSKMISN